MTGQQWLVVLLVVMVTWAARPYLRVLWRLFRPLPPPDVFGSAAWMPPRDVQAMTQRPGLIVGREPERPGRLLRYAGEAHLMTIAPTRSGKGVGVIIPNLLTTERSVLCIDPKGENARVAAHARRRFGPVWVLDPFGVSGEPAAACNPLDAVDPDDPIEDVATLAEALVVDPPGQVAEAHWNEEAKALIGGLVRERLTLPPDDLVTTLERMQHSPATHGLVARAANRHLGKAECYGRRRALLRSASHPLPRQPAHDHGHGPLPQAAHRDRGGSR